MARPRRPIEPERRARLMAEARRHFARHGFRGAVLSDLLADAGFSRSSFYYFFETKEGLFRAALVDGLQQIGARVAIPDPDGLTADSFWPSLRSFLDDLAAASSDPNLVFTGTLFYLPDAPEDAALNGFTEKARNWCQRFVEAGRNLGVVDRSLPLDLHVELVWSVATTMDRWMTAYDRTPSEAAVITQMALERVLGRVS